MRRKDPLIVGAGPAGCAAAIALARGGARPLLVDREAVVGDALCGGFLSWKTAARLESLGLDPNGLGAHRVDRLVIFAGDKQIESILPHSAWGLSRRTLDTALRETALSAGAELAIDTVRKVSGLSVSAQNQAWEPESLFLATGKHDVRGAVRPRNSGDPALGIRLRLTPSPGLSRRLVGRIELHLFDGGYAGIVLQESGSANICMAVRKSLLSQHGGDPQTLLEALARRHPHFALRLESTWRDARVDTIGAVPYGWSTGETEPGLFRLGDQAAVIPSLAGEGIDIALASGLAAAEAWLGGGADAAQGYQRSFHARAQAPLRWADAAWKLGETPALAAPLLALARYAPQVLPRMMKATRLP